MANEFGVELLHHGFDVLKVLHLFNDLESKLSDLDNYQVVLRIAKEIFWIQSRKISIFFSLLLTISLSILNILINELYLLLDPLLNQLIALKIFVGLLELRKLFIDPIKSLRERFHVILSMVDVKWNSAILMLLFRFNNLILLIICII